MSDINNTQDIMDSRDVIARIDEIEDALPKSRHEVLPGDSDEINDLWDELKALKTLAAEAEVSPDWQYGETLIRDTYFKEYAEELAEDCGLINSETVWPNNHIDWDAAADALKQDYMSVDFDSIEYWIRT
jgi:hypothetical protein